jgi:hypothetical protein
MNWMKAFGWVLCVWLLVTGSTSHAAEAPAKFKVGEFSFTRPTAWEWVEVTSPMRKAQLRVPGANKEEYADVIFFHFGPGPAGGTQANIDRWFRQFREPKDQIKARTEEATAGKTEISYVHAEGTYMEGMPGGPQTPRANYALLGAILESGEGNVFVKMTGPAALVKASEQEFKKLVEANLQ